jgi:acyl-coenzyme A synthetase/AMP-(fatty) acid ligase
VSGDILILPDGHDINAMIACFVNHRVNTLSATPSQWRRFLSHGGLSQCPLQQITLGGEIADQAILSALARQFPAARIVHIYASTEAGVAFSVADQKAGFPEAWLGEGPPVDMKISDSGSLLIRSPALSGSESLRPRLDADGYLDTEDGVRIIAGRVHFLGRVTGLINVGGNKVHPEEVENLVREMPGIQNALVSAKASPILGQLVVLDVQAGDLSPRESMELKRRIRDHCRKHLPDYKVPALINVVRELAVSESGKIERTQSA